MRRLFWLCTEFATLRRAKKILFNVSLNEQLSRKNIIWLLSESFFNFMFEWVLRKSRRKQHRSIRTCVLPSVSRNCRIEPILSSIVFQRHELTPSLKQVLFLLLFEFVLFLTLYKLNLGTCFLKHFIKLIFIGKVSRYVGYFLRGKEPTWEWITVWVLWVFTF